MRGNPQGGDERASFDVVIVDDDPDVGTSTLEVLELGGLRVALAPTLHHVDQLMEAYQVRSLVVDHSLAVLDGDDWLVERTKAPIILVSGLGSEHMQTVLRRFGERVFACMEKPVDPHELIHAVRQALASRDSLRDLDSGAFGRHSDRRMRESGTLLTCRICWTPITIAAENIEVDSRHVYFRCPKCGHSFPVRHSDGRAADAVAAEPADVGDAGNAQ